ncbi:questin oxidase family protein [Streptomyces apocyni]|uniref:questin oxidase family protein n=1 Tax=Streptomyces apocyni TaxID=2654677 RepID=UPI0012EA4491|nr:questin oxidase family protein [Streptomyces apocyni]
MTDSIEITDTSDTTGTTDTTGTLDEALQRLHALGPEYEDRLSNHGPMAVEALVRHGQAASVHRWLDRYSTKLEDLSTRDTPVTDANWSEALGDRRRTADWIAYFERQVTEEGQPWQEVLAQWWPRLLSGIAASATHSVIRVGHSVRTLLDGGDSAPRVAELAHALGYWAACHQPLPELKTLDPVPPSALAALDAVEPIPEPVIGINNRLAQLTAFPRWPATGPADPMDPDATRAALRELVTASVHRYATHGHGNAVMMVHSATAPNAVLRTLPALPHELWPMSLAAAWTASAAITAAYTPREGVAYIPDSTDLTPDEVFDRAAAHGDDHAIKFTDTALDVGDATALTAASRSLALIDPVG